MNPTDDDPRNESRPPLLTPSRTCLLLVCIHAAAVGTMLVGGVWSDPVAIVAGWSTVAVVAASFVVGCALILRGALFGDPRSRLSGAVLLLLNVLPYALLLLVGDMIGL